MDMLMTDQIWGMGQKNTLCQLAAKVAVEECLFLEIGSWCGSSSILLGKIAQQYRGMVFCVDWWKGSEGTCLTNIANSNDIFKVFWDNVVKEGLTDVIVPIRGDSSCIHRVLGMNSFDFVFIDGDHRYDMTIQDIDNYKPLAKRGGILSGHDCEGRIEDYDKDFLEQNKNNDYVNGTHCGVVLAVGKSFKDYTIENTIWSVQIP